MIDIVKYKLSYKKKWDEFVAQSKNGLFLFNRNYMDYHAERIHDHSLMFYNKEKLVALMPASEKNYMLVSHGGLTFGGIVSGSSMKIPLMIDIFEAMVSYLRKSAFNKLIYKAIPHIYHQLPAEEDLYALFIHKGSLTRRDVSSTVALQENINFSKLRKRCIKKAHKVGLKVRRNQDFETFMRIEEYVLKKYHNLKPVHTASEIRMLANLFPDNIKLFSAYQKDKILAGTIIFESNNVAHAQYIASTDEGKDVGASDIIFDYLISEYYSEKKFFDFGVSTENDGLYLNTGLVSNKEGFGARTTVYDFYELTI